MHPSTNVAGMCMEKPPYLSYFLPFFSLLTSRCAVSSPEIVPLCRCTFPRHPGVFSISLFLTTNVSLASNRLSSLTIGDSERRSSGAQQRDPSADLPAESAGNDQGSGGGVIANALPLNGANLSSPRPRTHPEMRGRAEGPAGLRLHRLRGEG